LTLFGKRAQILELFGQVETALYENERLLYPKCYFRQDLFVGAELHALQNRLVDIIKKHKGSVTQSMDDADHIIYPPSVDEIHDASSSSSSKCQWIRVLRKDTRRESILVHRLFTPDSHDEWIANLDVDDEMAGLNDSSNNASGSEVWEVTSQWLFDTDMYNEWMNQEDYEVGKFTYIVFSLYKI
jgi:SWI/SNF related-matrix-associated actin-dependent regulator of chromatin subfamily C